MTCPPELDADRAMILDQTRGLWDELRGGRVFLTGGTGFFGAWLLHSFAWANAEFGLHAQAVVLTRDPRAFSARMPDLACDPAITLVRGDVRDFAFPDGEYPWVIHAATPSVGGLDHQAPLEMCDIIVQGTRRTLDFAVSHGGRRFLFTSSGAVYARGVTDVTHISEEYRSAPDPLDPRSVYGEGKRAAELLCGLYCREYGLEAAVARCFAFVGPYLPLDAHYAVGNFLADALAGRPVSVKGDGTPYRSYLYAADLAVWLWTLLFRAPSCRAYNVGSDVGLTIAEVARLVAELVGNGRLEIAGTAAPGQLAQRYVPDIRRARQELNLDVRLSLTEAIRRTAQFYGRPQPTL